MYMYYKNRILLIPSDKSSIDTNMISDNVIKIKYTYANNNYTSLIALVSKIINKYKNNILNIKSVGIITNISTNGISIVKDEEIDVNINYDSNNISIVKLETFIYYISTALQLISNNQKIYNLDLIASNVITNNSKNILTTISANSKMIINTSRSEINSSNCVLDFSTNYQDTYCKRRLIGRYFRGKIAEINTILSVVHNPDSIIDKIARIFESALMSITDLLPPVKAVTVCLNALKAVLDLLAQNKSRTIGLSLTHILKDILMQYIPKTEPYNTILPIMYLTTQLLENTIDVEALDIETLIEMLKYNGYRAYKDINIEIVATRDIKEFDVSYTIRSVILLFIRILWHTLRQLL